MKMKAKIPTLREKYRYIYFKIHKFEENDESEEKISIGELSDVFWKTSIEIFGEIGASKGTFWIIAKEYDEEKGTGIIRCNSKTLHMLRTILLFITEINGKKVIIHPYFASGTLKALKRKIRKEKVKN